MLLVVARLACDITAASSSSSGVRVSIAALTTGAGLPLGLFAWEMRERRRVGCWLRSLSGRKHKNAAIVSLANKLARIV